MLLILWSTGVIKIGSPSSEQTYHRSDYNSIIITKDEIYGSLPRQDLTNYTEFQIQNKNGIRYSPISDLFLYYSSFFLVHDPNNRENIILAYYLQENNDPYPRFVYFGDKKPVALFGNNSCAVIDSEGAIIFIYFQDFIRESCYCFKNTIDPIFLPNQEKAIKVVIGSPSSGLFSLSSTGKVYYSPLAGSEFLSVRFFSMPELEGIKIVDVSSLSDHCLVLSDDGRVFGYGYNDKGQLGIGKEIKEVINFTEIKALSQYNICSISAGVDHSLFKTADGKVLACGSNFCGQLFLNSGASNECYYLPIETSINSNATYIIAGNGSSTVFIGCDPISSPNKLIKSNEIDSSIENQIGRNGQQQ